MYKILSFRPVPTITLKVAYPNERGAVTQILLVHPIYESWANASHETGPTIGSTIKNRVIPIFWDARVGFFIDISKGNELQYLWAGARQFGTQPPPAV